MLVASVLAARRAPGFSGTCSRLGYGHTSGTRVLGILLVVLVLATLRAPGFSGSCSRLGPGHTSGIRILMIVLSLRLWPHFGHQVSNDRVVAWVVTSLWAPSFSGPCCRLGSGRTSATRVLRIVLVASVLATLGAPGFAGSCWSPRFWPHFRYQVRGLVCAR